MDVPLRVLIIEDNPLDAELLVLELVNGGYDPSVLRVQTAPEMQAALDGAEWDLILSDYTLPRFSGVHALELLQRTERDIPFILISGSAGEDVAVTAMRAGAHDFFTKGNLGLLVPAIQRELREAEMRSVARRQREQLHQNEKLAALGTLMAGVAHELNNPLTIILHQTTMLQRALAADPLRERTAMILQAVNSCSRIVKNFLALARHEPPPRTRISINDIVHAAMSLVSFGLRSDGIDVRLELADDMPMIEGDPLQLERVVINLVSNAQYVLRSRPAPRRVSIRTAAAGATVLLRVTDNGPGIPADIRSRIFDPFFTTKPVGAGTGLGLSLCHGIITAHQGTITVSSELDAGTTFAVALPIASDASAEHARSAQESSSGAAQEILVVDDNPNVAAAFMEILTSQGHRVDLASTGRAALDRILTGRYAVVVTDMQMPDLDGPALYREVTARCPMLARTFLFISGDTFGSENDVFFKQTDAVYLGKPCTFDEVESAVARVLRRSRG